MRSVFSFRESKMSSPEGIESLSEEKWVCREALFGGWKDSSGFAEKNHGEQKNSCHVEKVSSGCVEKNHDE